MLHHVMLKHKIAYWYCIVFHACEMVYFMEKVSS